MLRLEPDLSIEDRPAANADSALPMAEGSILIKLLTSHILQSSAKTKLRLQRQSSDSTA